MTSTAQINRLLGDIGALEAQLDPLQTGTVVFVTAAEPHGKRRQKTAAAKADVIIRTWYEPRPQDRRDAVS